MPTKPRATRPSPVASAASGAPSPIAPTTAKVDEEPTRIEMTHQPVSQLSYEGLPDKTVKEMMAGRAAILKHDDKCEQVNILMTQTAEEMFSTQAKIRLTDKRVELQKGTTWAAKATLDPGAHQWTVTVSVHRPGAPLAELSEPFPQFPSDEMIAWIIMVG